MEKFLFNINSSNWFAKVFGRVISIEVFLILMIISFTIVFNVIAYEAKNGLEYSWRSLVAGLFVMALIAQYIIFSRGNSVSKEIEDHFWKTQLWRFKDPSYSNQELKYNEKYGYFPGQRELELSEDWEYEYDETTDQTYAKRYKFIQKFRWWIGIAFILGTTLITYFI